MADQFDKEEAKKFLLAKEEKEKSEQEEKRKLFLQKTISILQQKFTNSTTEIYLIGSILQPFSFSSHSDIDIIMKNYQGDRFELWSILEKEIGRRVEIILFEKCHFQEFILKNGFNVV